MVCAFGQGELLDWAWWPLELDGTCEFDVDGLTGNPVSSEVKLTILRIDDHDCNSSEKCDRARIRNIYLERYVIFQAILQLLTSVM